MQLTPLHVEHSSVNRMLTNKDFPILMFPPVAIDVLGGKCCKITQITAFKAQQSRTHRRMETKIICLRVAEGHDNQRIIWTSMAALHSIVALKANQ